MRKERLATQKSAASSCFWPSVGGPRVDAAEFTTGWFVGFSAGDDRLAQSGGAKMLAGRLPCRLCRFTYSCHSFLRPWAFGKRPSRSRLGSSAWSLRDRWHEDEGMVMRYAVDLWQLSCSRQQLRVFRSFSSSPLKLQYLRPKARTNLMRRALLGQHLGRQSDSSRPSGQGSESNGEPPSRDGKRVCRTLLSIGCPPDLLSVVLS